MTITQTSSSWKKSCSHGTASTITNPAAITSASPIRHQVYGRAITAVLDRPDRENQHEYLADAAARPHRHVVHLTGRDSLRDLVGREPACAVIVHLAKRRFSSRAVLEFPSVHRRRWVT